VKRASDTTGSISEAYLTVTVILGMTLYTLDMIQTLIGGNASGIQQLFVFAYVVVPLLSVGFIYLLDAVQPKWPYVDYRPYKVFGMFTPLGLALFVIPLPVPFFLHMAIALLAIALVPAAIATRASRDRRKLEKALPDFIRDVAEGRKTGLSPERSLERLVGRHYGILSKHVKKMGSQLTWGVSLSKVISTFTSEVRSWLTKAIGTLLIEVVDVGGGTIRSFSEMADFTRNINDMEGERRAALRPFVFIAYVAGIMVIMTTFIMVFLLGEPLTIGSSAAQSSALNGGTIDALLTTSIFDSFIIGIVAGKMGESSVADGFKHGVALVVISVISVYVVGLFIKIPGVGI
jgi:flagellar protein FlaJ